MYTASLDPRRVANTCNTCQYFVRVSLSQTDLGVRVESRPFRVWGVVRRPRNALRLRILRRSALSPR